MFSAIIYLIMFLYHIAKLSANISNNQLIEISCQKIFKENGKREL